VSRLTDLIAQAKAKDLQTGADLEREFKALSSRLPFGLNFERHRPEAVELPLRPIRKGDKVRVLPERGSTKKGDQRLWRAVRIATAGKRKVADLELLDAATPETQSVSLEDLIVVAEFKDTIYPGLVSTGKVERGGDKPYHTVINAENYHALKALTWSHRGKVDAIYIDPPYNTGAKDWKYNNDYVEGDDLYRHSKWLAFMERRLLLAKELLNPVDSVLIVTIDEKEYLRLGLLLEQLFPDSRIQMVSDQINPANVARKGGFGRSDEYIFFVMFGECVPQRVVLGDDWVSTRGRTFTGSVRWDLLRRSGTNARRADRPRLFYPILVNPTTRTVVGTGDPPEAGAKASKVPSPKGIVAVWPIRKDGSEGNWQLGPASLMKHVDQGRVRLGGSADEGFVAYYIKGGEYQKVVRGDYPVLGRNDDGSLNLGDSDQIVNLAIPGTQWRVAAHDATQYGSRLLGKVVPNRVFPFPKSLYSVEDALRFFLSNRPGAVVLDYFAGSGTTAHAVIRLNQKDQGRRQCISVTNNEVAAQEQVRLGEQGLRPGDADWEKWGISEYITKARISAVITGKTPEGEPIKGDYKLSDDFPMSDGFEENAEFFTLTYETPVSVSHDVAFSRIAPLLWMRAGSRGRRIEKIPAAGWQVVDTYGLLTELDEATAFLKAMRKASDVRIAYIVTDDERRFQALARRLPEGVEPVRLYESYLTNFAFANGSEE
jgi:adenine-specific DNA-methyltransferase